MKLFSKALVCFLVVLAFVFSGVAQACPDEAALKAQKFERKSQMLSKGQTMTLSLPNMHCGGCAKKVKSIAGSHLGLDQPKINLAAKNAVVECTNESCDVGSLLYDLQKSGYMIKQ
jgi:copper chaperone CopZ